VNERQLDKNAARRVQSMRSIDLSTSNATAFREQLAPFTQHARTGPVGSRAFIEQVLKPTLT
jgi:hypothetical protein